MQPCWSQTARPSRNSRHAAFRTTGYSGTIFYLPVSIWLHRCRPGGGLFFALDADGAAHLRGGGNERAAALSGIRVNRVRLFVYMISGFCAAIVGLIISSELPAAHPATGTTFELKAIASAVLGGASMLGGRGTIGDTIIGALVIGILSDGLVMTGVGSSWQMVIIGAS